MWYTITLLHHIIYIHTHTHTNTTNNNNTNTNNAHTTTTTGSEAIKPIIAAGEILSSQIFVQENQNYITTRSRLVNELIQLDTTLKSLPDLNKFRIILNTEIAKNKYEIEKKLNSIQEKLLMNVATDVKNIKLYGSPVKKKIAPSNIELQDKLHVAFGSRSPSRSPKKSK